MKTGNTPKSSKLFIGGATVMVAAATAALFSFHSCDTKVEGPIALAVRGDGVCLADLEGSPYQRDARTGRVLLDSSKKPIPNPNYSKEDCHRGDGVCDIATDKSQLKDSNGNPIPDFMDTFTDKRTIALPLEDQSSLDCVMIQVVEQPCGPADAQTLTRATISIPKLITSGNERKRLRTQEEVENVHTNPGLFAKEGGDMYTVVVDYAETCDSALPLCTPHSAEACYCGNLPECRVTTCGNGAIDKGSEQCDSTSGKKRGGCKTGNHCERCKCVKDASKPVVVAPPSVIAPPPAEIGPCTYGPNKTDLTNRTANAMLGKAGELRQTLGAGGSITITVKYLVDMNGKPTTRDISARCDGIPCSNDASTGTIQSITGLNPGAATLGSPPAPCFLSVRVNVPQG